MQPGQPKAVGQVSPVHAPPALPGPAASHISNITGADVSESTSRAPVAAGCSGLAVRARLVSCKRPSPSPLAEPSRKRPTVHRVPGEASSMASLSFGPGRARATAAVTGPKTLVLCLAATIHPSLLQRAPLLQA